MFLTYQYQRGDKLFTQICSFTEKKLVCITAQEQVFILSRCFLCTGTGTYTKQIYTFLCTRTATNNKQTCSTQGNKGLHWENMFRTLESVLKMGSCTRMGTYIEQIRSPTFLCLRQSHVTLCLIVGEIIPETYTLCCHHLVQYVIYIIRTEQNMI